MNEWDQRIREHSVWTKMKALGPVIDDAAAIKDLAPEARAGIERIRAVLAYCGKRIAAAEPMITMPASLDAIASNLTAVQNELQAFINDKTQIHIVTSNNILDGLLVSVSQIPGAYSPEELGSLISLVVQYREMVEKSLSAAKDSLEHFSASSAEKLTALNASSETALSAFKEKSDSSLGEMSVSTESLETRLGQIATTIQAEQQKLAAILSDQQGQFSTAQEARSKDFSESLRLSTEGVNKLVTDYQSQFSVAQDTRSKDFSSAQSVQQANYKETIAEYAKKLAEQDVEFTKQRTEFVSASKGSLDHLAGDYDDEAKKILTEIQERQQHVEKLVGVIGNLGVTSGYLRRANQAQSGMWGWQAATILALITLSWTAYRTLGLLEGSSGQFNWGGFAGRALLLASLGVIAAYSSSQADKLFGDERRNRKLALELEAIGPYLAPLPAEEQNKFRVQIGEKSFGRDHVDLHEHRKSPSSILDILKSKKGDLMLEVAKKAKDLK
jgi:hypothetical protein